MNTASRMHDAALAALHRFIDEDVLPSTFGRHLDPVELLMSAARHYALTEPPLQGMSREDYWIAMLERELDDVKRLAAEARYRELPVDNYFGGCPQCGRDDGCANVGRSHWFYCKEHKVKWCIGSNLFSTWRDETEEEQRRIYNEIGLGDFTEVEPLPCNNPKYKFDAPEVPLSDDSVPF
jgi:hypothetical protein